MSHDYVIIGGGVAGLSAAIRLAELGIESLVIESGDYPAHKVCGEFFSPECLPVLDRWGINYIKIDQCQWNISEHNGIHFRFPQPAGSLSHYSFDTQLMGKAQREGVQIKIKTKAVHFKRENNQHLIELSTGETILAKNLIIAVGRLPALFEMKPLLYWGVKAHFTGIDLKYALNMHSFAGGYIGLSPIENGHVNVAGLISRQVTNDPEAFVEQLISTSPSLQPFFAHAKNLFSKWMIVGIPNFGIKESLNWPTTYLIGDAAGTIPPITGLGLSMAIRGGIMVAEHALKGNPVTFRKEWLHTFQNPIRFGKCLHSMGIKPSLGRPLLRLGRLFPYLIIKIYQLTR